MTTTQSPAFQQETADGLIRLSTPDVGPLEEQAVVRAIRSGCVAPAGPDLDDFEIEMAQRIGVDHAVGLASGTAALHLGLLTLGVQPGDVVITSTLTFAATANAIIYTGAEPFFIDVDEATGNMDAALLDLAIDSLQRSGERIGAVIPVDLLGKSADYTLIEEITARYGIPVLADAAEAVGATHQGRPAGSFGDAAAVSFNGNKIMTTSGGGMLLTNDRELADNVRYLSTQARQPVAHYEHTEIGYNYRLSNLLAAVGRAQLSRLDALIAKRRAVREQYLHWSTATAGIEIFGGVDDQDDNCWLTAILLDPQRYPESVESLIATMADHGVETRRLWKPMHLQPVFSKNRSLLSGAADRLYKHGVTLPSGSNMTEGQLERVQTGLDAFFGGAR